MFLNTTHTIAWGAPMHTLDVSGAIKINEGGRGGLETYNMYEEDQASFFLSIGQAIDTAV